MNQGLKKGIKKAGKHGVCEGGKTWMMKKRKGSRFPTFF